MEKKWREKDEGEVVPMGWCNIGYCSCRWWQKCIVIAIYNPYDQPEVDPNTATKLS